MADRDWCAQHRVWIPRPPGGGIGRCPAAPTDYTLRRWHSLGGAFPWQTEYRRLAATLTPRDAR